IRKNTYLNKEILLPGIPRSLQDGKKTQKSVERRTSCLNNNKRRNRIVSKDLDAICDEDDNSENNDDDGDDGDAGDGNDDSNVIYEDANGIEVEKDSSQVLDDDDDDDNDSNDGDNNDNDDDISKLD
ncbi:8518_t:CDS:2, partial [Cetraspora pellucida]